VLYNVCCNQLHLVAAIEDDMSHFDRAHWHPRSGVTTAEDARLSPLLSSVVILALSGGVLGRCRRGCYGAGLTFLIPGSSNPGQWAQNHPA
jgi:hypothetical protein